MAGIKRHEALQELSRHHHHALVVAMNLKRGKNEDMDRLRQEVIEFWGQGGNEHFREEEDVLLPTYAMFKDLTTDENVIRMLLQHVQIRMLVQTIRNGKSTAVGNGDVGETEAKSSGASEATYDVEREAGSKVGNAGAKGEILNLDVFHELGSLLKEHVQLEEQIVFKEIQETVPEPDLFAIQHFFHEM
jgi:hypothetical protein